MPRTIIFLKIIGHLSMPNSLNNLNILCFRSSGPFPLSFTPLKMEIYIKSCIWQPSPNVTLKCSNKNLGVLFGKIFLKNLIFKNILPFPSRYFTLTSVVTSRHLYFVMYISKDFSRPCHSTILRSVGLGKNVKM